MTLRTDLRLREKHNIRKTCVVRVEKLKTVFKHRESIYISGSPFGRISRRKARQLHHDVSDDQEQEMEKGGEDEEGWSYFSVLLSLFIVLIINLCPFL